MWNQTGKYILFLNDNSLISMQELFLSAKWLILWEKIFFHQIYMFHLQLHTLPQGYLLFYFSLGPISHSTLIISLCQPIWWPQMGAISRSSSLKPLRCKFLSHQLLIPQKFYCNGTLSILTRIYIFYIWKFSILLLKVDQQYRSLWIMLLLNKYLFVEWIGD